MTPKPKPASQRAFRNAVVHAVARLMESQGCGCCADHEGLNAAQKDLRRLLGVPDGTFWSDLAKPRARLP